MMHLLQRWPLQVWEAGSLSWSGLALHLRAEGLQLEDLARGALLPTATVAAKYLDVLKDPWVCHRVAAPLHLRRAKSLYSLLHNSVECEDKLVLSLRLRVQPP